MTTFIYSAIIKVSNRNYSPLYFCAAQALFNNCSGCELHRYLKRGDLLEFITTGNRIAVENFSIGKVYTIVWATGNYKSLACVGKGSDFVMFQDQAPDLLFCLTMDTAIAVESIDEGGGGAGTMNYNELENKPSINGIVLVGNKTGADLGLASQSDLEDYATNASVVAGLATKQDALSSSQLAAVNSGITSELVTQIGTNTSAIAGKQDALSSSQLAAVNSGIDSTKVAQIETNKNNISLYGKADNIISTSFTWSDGYITKNDGKITASTQSQFSQPFTLHAGEKITVRTRNTYIGIICSTTADSLSVGDTVTVLRYTSGVLQDETYEYIATEDIKITICVLKSNYAAYVSTKADTLSLASYATAAIMRLQDRVTALESQ